MKTQITRLRLDSLGRDTMFAQALHIWHQTVGEAGIERGLKALEAICDAATNLYFTDMNASTPLAFRLKTFRQAFDLKHDRGQEIGLYPDRKYVDDVLIPNYMATLSEGRPALRRIMAPVQGRFAVYEGLFLPNFDRTGRRSLSLSRLLFLAEDIDGDVLTALSARERQSLDHLTIGLSAKQIAALLKLSGRTVEHHIESIKAKLSVRNVSHAVAKNVILSLGGDRSARYDAPSPQGGRLSLREGQCLNLIASGRSSRYIASELGISAKSVEKYIVTLKGKLGARNAAQLAAKGVLAVTASFAETAA
jgi:DNA-binding CsgD family transcriptional regulator